MRWAWFAVLLGVVSTLTVAHAAPRPVTIYLERNGRVVSDDVRIPKFGGGDRAWNGIVACVREHFAPFQVDIVDEKPRRGDFITAVLGGRASQLGLDDRWTNGVGPHSGRVIPKAIVFVFTKVGTGERDVSNLCAVTAHEVAHALGLDHSYKCGDIMSYFLDRCGKRRFMDVDAPCGEDRARTCADGSKTQNSYRKLGTLVGFRKSMEVEPEPPAIEEDPWEVQPRDPYNDESSDDESFDNNESYGNESYDESYEDDESYDEEETYESEDGRYRVIIRRRYR